MPDFREYYKKRVTSDVEESLLWQVGKTVNGQEVPFEHIDIIVSTITEYLELAPSDNILDIGCGNGLLTKLLAPKVENVIGIDATPELIAVAKKKSLADNISYFHLDATKIGSGKIVGDVDKVYSYEVVQHLSLRQIETLITDLFSIFPMLKRIYLGGILDDAKKWEFINSAEKRYRYYASLLSGNDPLGNWLHKDFFHYLARNASLECEIINQKTNLYTAHYRYDCLLINPDV